MTFTDKTVLITGANRGLGRALVAEALERGAARVYAGTRVPMTHPDARVVPVQIDVTDSAEVQAAAATVGALDVLVNNAGIALPETFGDDAALERHFAVNCFGAYAVTQAFLPALTRSRGRIVNVLSLSGVAAMPLQPSYSMSKAAAFSMTQSLRMLLAGEGVGVHAVLLGPTDTDMTRGFDIPKAAPAAVASRVFDGVEKGEEDIFPDPLSSSTTLGWDGGPTKALERHMATYLQAAGNG
ncbi:SDR family NAD(P)-dependent oxidoreductase [Glycomyces albidus]|jgi:NAD(P)-dependent dehydrogenase (short-subunit alcohol dehydrogenase family)|uniref:SDR family NAD(P)-dependent oxidoreductase n=1 Tax=Glycomyces albidus TaxID=2656774 RepID=A0A6L5G4V2_9ACTN|nr:SDR family NAD(P)-dependent oxidoreductase [Glycomyces albidus]MQM24673.1 SDR family NAD(P)-dependent oxidoreductase [Glycomyces albidus]